MVKCVLVQEINQLFIKEVLLKTSLMKKEMPPTINSLSNRILSTLKKTISGSKEFSDS